jgi:hypothetical protein
VLKFSNMLFLASVVTASCGLTWLLGHEFGPAGSIFGIGLSGVVGTLAGRAAATWEG